MPGFGELELLRCALAQVWRECEWTFEARLLPKVSTSVGDRKALHNDGNGTALTAHVVVEAGDRESEMCVLFGQMEITVAMERPRTTFFLASLPHCTRRVGDKGFSNTSNTSKDKVYMSAYWTADVERLLREAGLERGVALGATYEQRLRQSVRVDVCQRCARIPHSMYRAYANVTILCPSLCSISLWYIYVLHPSASICCIHLICRDQTIVYNDDDFVLEARRRERARRG